MAPTDRFVSENTFYVRYAETDAMAITHHSNYIVYFEEARSHYSRVRGADYADFERSGYWLTVGRSPCPLSRARPATRSKSRLAAGSKN